MTALGGARILEEPAQAHAMKQSPSPFEYCIGIMSQGFPVSIDRLRLR